MGYQIIHYRHTYSSDICLEIYEADVDYGVKMTEIDFTPPSCYCWEVCM